MNLKPSWILLVFIGGAIGTLLRAIVGEFLGDFIGLLAVNLLGTAFLAWFNAMQANPSSRLSSEGARGFWGAGFAGGFTTMSGLALFTVVGTSSYEAWSLIAYALITLACGVLVYIGVFKLVTKTVRKDNA